MVKLVPLSEFYEQPTIASRLPLVFESGAEWYSITASCSQCDRCVPDDDLRGTVSEHAEESYRVRKVLLYYIDARAYCQPCNVLTPCCYGLTEKDLVEIRGDQLLVYGSTRSRWTRVKDWFRRLFGADASA